MTDALFDLTGKTALITGASRGIGEATAHLLAKHGAHVIVSSRKLDPCEEVVTAIRQAGGVASAIEAHMLTDLLKQAGIRAWVRGEHLQGALGELSAAGLVRLEVDEADVLPARAQLTQWEAEQPPAAPAARRTVVLVERANGELDSLVVGANGSFKLQVEADSRLRLTFRQNGYITKVVEVNTINAFPKFKAENDRDVRFSVELMPQSPSNDLVFAAPVGHITFIKGSGLMKVHYDHTLVTLPATDVTAAR